MLKGREREKFKSRLVRGDRVVVIAGNDRGKSGKILARKPSGFIVEGVQVRKKHLRQQRQGNQTQGGIVDMETPIHPCKLAPCTEDGKPSGSWSTWMATGRWSTGRLESGELRNSHGVTERKIRAAG
jgi:ribosomal protein L24